MLYLLFLLVWWILGVITVFLVAGAHVYKAYMQGYDNVYTYIKTIFKEYMGAYAVKPWLRAARFIWGATIWPIRLSQFREIEPYLYEMYDKLRNEEEES